MTRGDSEDENTVVMDEQARLTGEPGIDLGYYIITPVGSRGSGVIAARGNKVIRLQNVEWSTRELKCSGRPRRVDRW